jgi:hypothetical protein
MSVSVNANPAFSPASSAGPASSGVVINGQAMTVQDLMLLMTLNSLKSQDAVFENLFRECEERTQQLNQLSTCMQILGKYRDYFDKDGNPVKNIDPGKRTWLDMPPSNDREALLTAGVADLVKQGLVPGLDKICGVNANGGIGFKSFTKGEFDSVMENMKLAQSQMSSVNEQQMMRANQAANKRATILQFGQSLLQSIKEANQAGSR